MNRKYGTNVIFCGFYIYIYIHKFIFCQKYIQQKYLHLLDPGDLPVILLRFLPQSPAAAQLDPHSIEVHGGGAPRCVTRRLTRFGGTQ